MACKHQCRHIRKTAKSDTQLRIACLPVCLSIGPSWRNGSFLQDGFSWGLFRVFHEILSRKFKFRYSLRRMKGILHKHKHVCKFMITHWFIFRIGNFADKILQEIKKYICVQEMFSQKIVPLMRLGEKKNSYTQTGHIRPYNTAHALCMLGK